MNKKARRTNRIQNILIITLTISALLMLTQTALFGSLSAHSPDELIGSLFGSETASGSSTQASLSSFAAPVRLLYTNDFARFGQESITILDSEFEAVSPYLSEALISASSPSQISEQDFLLALQSPGIYLDFTASLPLSVLKNSLGITDNVQNDSYIRRILLCPDDTGTTRMYFADGGDDYTLYSTALSATSLTEFLNAQSGNGAYLSAQLPDEFVRLSPYTLILSEQAPRYTLSASNPLSNTDYSDLLRAAEFNPHTENRYTETSGTTVVREGDSSLRIDPNGIVSYQGGKAESGSVYALSAQSSKVSAVEAVAAAENLAAVLLQDSGSSSSLYLSSIEKNGTGYTITLDYIINGTPLCFSDSSHAFSATIAEQSITAFSLHFRSYTITDEAALILPLQQALAIAESRYEGSEPFICYVDSGAESVLPGWIAE